MYHLGSSSVSDSSLGDIALRLLFPLDRECDPLGYASEYMSEKPSMSPTQNVGLAGACSDTVLLPSMTFTVDMVGLSAGLSCTQSSPMFRSEERRVGKECRL